MEIIFVSGGEGGSWQAGAGWWAAKKTLRRHAGLVALHGCGVHEYIGKVRAIKRFRATMFQAG